MYNIEKVTINNPYNVSDLCSHIILDEPKMLVIDDCMPYITNYSFQFWHKSMNSGIITVTEENNTNVVETSDEWAFFNTSFTATKISKITLQFQPGEYWIYNMKLETGTIPTDWSPHPDDSNEITVLLEEKILHNSETIQNTISKVDANTQEILNRVDKTTYSADIELIDRQFQDADNRFSVLEDGFAKWYVEVYDKNDFQDSIDGESIESMNDMRIFGAKNSGITPQYEFMISDSSDEIYPIKIPEILMVDQKIAKEIWASVETPTIDNYPSSEWIDKAYHDGDLYLDANSKQIYQFNNPSWTHIQENLITINQTSDINSYTKCYSWVYNKYLYYYTFVKFNDYTSATVNYNSGYGSLYLNGILKKKIDQLEDMYSNNQIVLNFSPGWNVIEIICNECTANFPDSYISDNSNCILMNCLVAMPGTRTARTTSQHAYLNIYLDHIESSVGETINQTKTDLEGKITNDITIAKSEIKQTTDAIETVVSNHTTSIEQNTQNIGKNANDIAKNNQDITTINNNYSSLVQDLNGFKTIVSSTYATTKNLSDQIKNAKDYTDSSIENFDETTQGYVANAVKNVKDYTDGAVKNVGDAAAESLQNTKEALENKIVTEIQSSESRIEQTTNAISATVSGHTVAIQKNTNDIGKNSQNISVISNNYTELIQDLDGFKTTVSTQIQDTKNYADNAASNAEQRAVSTSSEQTATMFKLLVTSKEGDETSFILTDNLLQAITNQFVIKGQSGESVVIENGQIKSNSLITDIINADILKSSNYSAGSGTIPYSVLGTFFDLSTGNLYTPSLFIDSVNKNAYFKGTIYAQNGEIGSWNINNTSIWKGSSVLSTHGNGNMYLGNNGLSLSDVLVYDSATGLLNINANSISIGSNKINNTYYYNGTPTIDTYPTTGWTDYEIHINDLCYDTNTNKLYKFSGYNYNMIKITFANDCSTESKTWDWLMIFYEYNGMYYRTIKYGGISDNNTIKNAEICIPSNKFIIWWQTDNSANGYNGFRISNVSLYNGQSSISYEVGPDINSVYSYINSTKKTSNDITEFTMDTGVYPERNESNYIDNENCIYYCDSGLNIGLNCKWTEIQDVDILKSSQEATNYLYWNDSTGLIINNNKKITSIDDITDQIGGNIRLTGTGIGIYNGNKLLTEYGSVTKYYNPSNNIVAAQLDSNGLSIVNGSVELGTYGNSDYVFIGNNNTRNGLYLWNKLIYDANAGTLNIDVDSLNIKGKDLYSTMTNIGGNNTYFTNTIPLPSQYPSNTWVSEEEKQSHVGDICYDVSTGKIYRYQPDESNERIKITFTSESKTASNNDAIRIYFKKNDQICRTSMLYGDGISSYSDVIPAKNFWVHFISDSSSTAYGFKIESVSRADSDVPYSSIYENVNLPSTPCDTLPIGEYPESDHPYMNNTDKLWYVRPIINNSSYEWKEIESTAITEQIQEAIKKNNYIHYDYTNGVIIHNGLSNMPDGAWTNNDLNNLIGGNVRLVNDGLHIYKDNKEYASYGSTTYFYGYKDNGTQFTGAQIDADGFLIGSTDSQYLKWDGSNLIMKVSSLNIDANSNNGNSIINAINKGSVQISASRLNISADDINIDASKIRLTSTELSWNSTNSSMTKDGTLTCENANIKGTFRSDVIGGYLTIHDGEIRGYYGDTLTGYLDLQSNWGDGQHTVLSAPSSRLYLIANDEIRFMNIRNFTLLSIETNYGVVESTGINARPKAGIHESNAAFSAFNSRGDQNFFVTYAGILKKTGDYSDENSKKDIVHFGTSYKELFMKLNPISYKWKEGNSKYTYFGVGARETERYIHELGMKDLSLAHDNDGQYSVDYNALFTLMIPIVQEHEHRIEALEKENELLKQEIQLLKQSNNVNSYLVD